MLGIVLLAIGSVGLVLTLLSLFGLDFGDFDFDVGDSGAGLLSILMPFTTGFGLLAGGLMQFSDTPTWVALLVGLGTGVLLSVMAVALLGYLVGAEAEVPSLDFVGSAVRVIEPVSPGRYGVGEVDSVLGTQQITITSDEDLEYNASAVVVEKQPDRDSFVVVRVSTAF